MWKGRAGPLKAVAPGGRRPRPRSRSPSLHAAVAPLARVCRLLGLLVCRPAHGRFARSGRQVAYAAVVLLFYATVFFFCMRWRVQHLYVQMSTFMQYSDMLLWLTLLITDVVVIGMAALPRFYGRICAIFDLVANVDREILDDRTASYRKIEKFLVWQLSLAFVMCNSIVISESIVLSEPGLWSAVYYFAAASIHMVFILVMLQFIDLVLLLKTRFHTINKKLETFFNDDIQNPWTVNKVGGPSPPAAARGTWDLQRLGRAHLALCDAADLVNATYGAQILCCVATAFINVTTTFFDCLHNFRQEKSIMTEDVTIVFFCWILIFVLQVALVLAACSAAADEADRTPKLLQRLQGQGAWPGGELQVQARHLAAQTQARRVRFSACGLFRVDLSLACSMAQAVASYIVIMMQFDQQNQPPKPQPTTQDKTS